MSDLWKWAFDGVGGTFALAAISWLVKPLYGLYRKHVKKPRVSESNEKPEQLVGNLNSIYYIDVPFPPIPVSIKFTRPSPDEIQDQINSQPPFQRTTAARAYHGLEVCWPALFQHVEPRPLGGTTVTVKYYNSVKYSSAMIICDSPLTPKLKIAKENEPLIVRGTLMNVDSGFWLKDASIEFLD